MTYPGCEAVTKERVQQVWMRYGMGGALREDFYEAVAAAMSADDEPPLSDLIVARCLSMDYYMQYTS